MTELMPYILGFLGACIAGVVGLYGHRMLRSTKKVEEKLTGRRDTIADRDALITGFRADVAAMKTELANQKKEMAALRTEVESVRDHNNALIAFIYKMISLLRRHELLDQIEPGSVPPGVHI